MPAFELSDILAAASRSSHREDRDEPTKTPPDVLCLTLTEVAARYVAPCPFKSGDLVTPRKGYNIEGSGEPHVVLEVFDTAIRVNAPVDALREIGSPVFCSRIDMRVGCERRATILAYGAESWVYEPYTGPRAILD